MYERYLKTLRKLIDLILRINNQDEVKRMTLADERLADDRFAPRSTTKFRKGEIYQFEFGKNFFPEMSFEHRGLIVGVRDKLLYVLPICSYNNNEEAHRNAYHPTDNPNKKQDFYLLKSSEYNFIKRDSVIKLSDMRTISVNRKLYKHDGRLDIGGNTYKKIEDLVIQKYFNQFYFEFCELRNDNNRLQEEIEAMKSDKDKLEQKIQELSKQSQVLNKESIVELVESKLGDKDVEDVS